jgi:hypothetical protein
MVWSVSPRRERTRSARKRTTPITATKAAMARNI